MAMHDAGSITVNDVEIPLQVDDYNGHWTASYAGQPLSYETRDKLVNKLKTLTKKTAAKVEVHVIRVTPYGGYGAGNLSIARGVLTGLHAGTGNVLAAWQVRGKTEREQLTNWGQGGRVYVGGDTPDEALAEYNDIRKQLAELTERRDKWERRYQIKPKDAVEQALTAQANQAEGE